MAPPTPGSQTFYLQNDESISLSLSVTQFVVICYGSPSKPTPGSAEFEGIVCFRSTSMTTLVGWGTVEWGLMSADFEEMPCSPSTSMGQLQVARPGALLGGHQGGTFTSCLVLGKLLPL